METIGRNERAAGPPGQATRDRLVQAVERLLAETGDLDPSLREITAAAGTNVAAVNYHFGSKDALVRAVIERALQEHADQQLAAMDAVLNTTPDASIEHIVRAWLTPLTGPGPEPALIGHLAARVLSGGSPALRELGTRTHAAAMARLFGLLAERLPELPAEELAFRLTLVITVTGGLIYGAFDQAVIAGNQPVTRTPETDARAVSFLVGGLTARPTQPAHPGVRGESEQD
jgi:AcrR family transcriptional regulator